MTDDAKRLDLLKSLGLEAGMLLPADSNMGFETSTDGAMLRKNVIGVSAEFGGGGLLSPAMLGKCEDSIRRFLVHVGIMPSLAVPALDRQCQMYDIGDADAHVFSDSFGMFRADVTVGSAIGEGEAIGRLYDFYDPLGQPKIIINKMPGTVLAIRALPRTEVGDCLAQVGRPSGNSGLNHGI